jgi:hypothetical protein
MRLKELGLSRKDLVKHFCKVNDCSEKEFLQHEDEAFKVWEKRSNYEWKQDFGTYTKYVEGYI